MMRSPPQNLGTVEWPEAVPGTLTGLKFLSTGVFETIERDELYDIIRASGGRVYSSFSKHLDYLLVGRDAGPAKLADAEEYKVKILDEHETYEFLCQKLSGAPSKDGPSEETGEDVNETEEKKPKAKGKTTAKGKAKAKQVKPKVEAAEGQVATEEVPVKVEEVQEQVEEVQSQVETKAKGRAGAKKRKVEPKVKETKAPAKRKNTTVQAKAKEVKAKGKAKESKGPAKKKESTGRGKAVKAEKQENGPSSTASRPQRRLRSSAK